MRHVRIYGATNGIWYIFYILKKSAPPDLTRLEKLQKNLYKKINNFYKKRLTKKSGYIIIYERCGGKPSDDLKRKLLRAFSSVG